MNTEKLKLGIDIGGTKICFAYTDGDGIKGEVLCIRTPDNTDDILANLFAGIDTFPNKIAIGIATAGAVDMENSKVIGSTGNMPTGYSGLDLGKIIKDKYSLPVFVENDANAAAWAEYKAGSAKGHKNTITITLGTGVGGGIIVEGKILKGTTGAGAEVGHIPISWEKRRQCTCGNWDCWEAYASGTGYHKYPDEQHLWEEFIAMGLAGLINIFEPQSVILSGGMAKFVDYNSLRKRVSDRVLMAETKILQAKFENYAGLLGATMLSNV